mmetsp:Transcript_75279/g.166549  ORF Transcript_75279/g.166549 Transcript_75279/m.166549 type:complete len:264 (+) Transcript_75279:202-993(+)
MVTHSVHHHVGVVSLGANPENYVFAGLRAILVPSPRVRYVVHGEACIALLHEHLDRPRPYFTVWCALQRPILALVCEFIPDRLRQIVQAQAVLGIRIDTVPTWPLYAHNASLSSLLLKETLGSMMRPLEKGSLPTTRTHLIVQSHEKKCREAASAKGALGIVEQRYSSILPEHFAALPRCGPSRQGVWSLPLVERLPTPGIPSSIDVILIFLLHRHALHKLWVLRNPRHDRATAIDVGACPEIGGVVVAVAQRVVTRVCLTRW